MKHKMENRDDFLWIQKAIKDGRCKIVHAQPKVFGKLVLRIEEVINGFQVNVYRIPVSEKTYLGTIITK